MRAGRTIFEAIGGGGGAAGIIGGARNVRFSLWKSSPAVKYSGRISSIARIAKWMPTASAQSNGLRCWCAEVCSSIASSKTSRCGLLCGGRT